MQTTIAAIWGYLRTYTQSNTVREAAAGTAVDVAPLAGVEAVVDRQNVSVVVLTSNVWRKKQKHHVLSIYFSWMIVKSSQPPTTISV